MPKNTRRANTKTNKKLDNNDAFITTIMQKNTKLLEIASVRCFQETGFSENFSESDIKVKIENLLQKLISNIDNNKGEERISKSDIKKMKENIKKMAEMGMKYYYFYYHNINNIKNIFEIESKKSSDNNLDTIIEQYLSALNGTYITKDRKKYIRAYARHFFKNELENHYTDIALEALSEIYTYDINRYICYQYLKTKCTEFNFEEVKKFFNIYIGHILSIEAIKIGGDLNDEQINIKKREQYVGRLHQDDEIKRKIRIGAIKFYINNEKIMREYYNKIIPKIINNSSKEECICLIKENLKKNAQNIDLLLANNTIAEIYDKNAQNIDLLLANNTIAEIYDKNAQNIDLLLANNTIAEIYDKICNTIYVKVYDELCKRLYNIAKDIGYHALAQIKELEKTRRIMKDVMYGDIAVDKDNYIILEQINNNLKNKITQKNNDKVSNNRKDIKNNKQKTQEEILLQELKDNLAELEIKSEDLDFTLEDLNINDYILDLITFNIQGINKGETNKFGFKFAIENDNIRRLFDIKEKEDIKNNPYVENLAELAYTSIFLTYCNKDLLLFNKILERKNIQNTQKFRDIQEQLNKLENNCNINFEDTLGSDNGINMQKEILLKLNPEFICVIDNDYSDVFKILNDKISTILEPKTDNTKDTTITKPHTMTLMEKADEKEDGIMYYRYRDKSKLGM